MRTYKLYLFCRQGLVNIVPLPGLYQTLRRKAQFGCAVTGENSKGSYSGAPLLLRVLYDYCWVILNFFKVCISPQLLKPRYAAQPVANLFFCKHFTDRFKILR